MHRVAICIGLVKKNNMPALPIGSAVSWLLQIAHVRYIKILTRLRGFRNTIANFSRLHCLAIPRRELSTKKAQPNIEKWPESLGFKFEL